MAKKPRFLIHDESENSFGFSILTAGIDLSRFLSNPVMLYLHNNKTYVVGRWENIEIKGQQIFADAVFDTEDPTGAKIAKQVENGFLKATSLGITFKHEDFSSKDDGSLQLTKCEVYECSIVNVPSNKNALKVPIDKNVTTLQLCFKGLQQNDGATLQERLTELLGLDEGSDDDAIFEAVNALKEAKKPEQDDDTKLSLTYKGKGGTSIYKVLGLAANATPAKALSEVISLKLSNEALIATQTSLAAEFVDYAIETGRLPKHLKEVQLQAFALNFDKAKEDMLSTMPIKRQSFVMQLEQAKATKAYTANGGKAPGGQQAGAKPKAQWNLDDYRKLAPKELAADPQLYQRLIDEKYNNV